MPERSIPDGFGWARYAFALGPVDLDKLISYGLRRGAPQFELELLHRLPRREYWDMADLGRGIAHVESCVTPGLGQPPATASSWATPDHVLIVVAPSRPAVRIAIRVLHELESRGITCTRQAGPRAHGSICDRHAPRRDGAGALVVVGYSEDAELALAAEQDLPVLTVDAAPTRLFERFANATIAEDSVVEAAGEGAGPTVRARSVTIEPSPGSVVRVQFSGGGITRVSQPVILDAVESNRGWRMSIDTGPQAVRCTTASFRSRSTEFAVRAGEDTFQVARATARLRALRRIRLAD